MKGNLSISNHFDWTNMTLSIENRGLGSQVSRRIPDSKGKITCESSSERMDWAANSIPSCPEGFNGRGIVICGGGIRYYTCAYVCVRMLRDLGCTLPIELWHFGDAEISEQMASHITPFDVRCVDALAMRKEYPSRLLNGWELKPYSIVNSRFREVLFLDADNVPVIDPTYLFETPEFKSTGAIFWPDFSRLGLFRDIWNLTGVQYQNEPEFESGQIVIDKVKSWKPLLLALWMNEHSDFWFDYIHGDKETFHMAWRKLGHSYAMPRRPIEALPGTMCQHDFEKKRVFQHRNFRKWRIDGDNPRTEGFVHEDKCLEFLEDLRQVWDGSPQLRFNPDRASSTELEIASELASGIWEYHRVGYDKRFMAFSHDGAITHGKAGCEQYWGLRLTPSGKAVLTIRGEHDSTATLIREDVECWRGEWLIGERMKVEISRYWDNGN